MSSEKVQGIDERSDAELLEACLTGDQDAWAELVERYHRLIYSIALRYGLSSDDSADVVQNVFTIVLRRLETIQDRDRFGSWLITTTTRETWRFRHHHRPSDDLEDIELVDGRPLPEEEVIAWERASQVRIAVGRLNETCRELVSALFLDPHSTSYSELAERLDMPIGSIGPTRARCFKKLESELIALGVVESAAVPREL